MKNGIFIINSEGTNEEINYHLLYFTVIMDKELINTRIFIVTLKNVSILRLHICTFNQNWYRLKQNGEKISKICIAYNNNQK